MTSQPDISKPTISARKPYNRPTLVKGPVLSDVTAIKGPVISGVAPLPPCWVARAAFGEHDIRWLIFRAWLFEDAPAWFRQLYIRHGEKVGSWLEGRDDARRLVRALMMPAVNGKLRG